MELPQPYQQKNVASKFIKKHLPLEFIDHHNSIRKLQRLNGKIKRFMQENVNASYLLAMLYAAFKAQIGTIRYLNDDFLNCKIPWDKRTKLPSPASLAADVLKYAEQKNPRIPREIDGKLVSNPTLAALLESFSGWASFSEQTIQCSCGEFWGNFRSRAVNLIIMLQTVLKIDDKDRLHIKQLVAIRSDDQQHLDHHYDLKRESRLLDDGAIVLTAECIIKFDNAVAIEQIFQERTKYFDMEEMGKLVTAAVFGWKHW